MQQEMQRLNPENHSGRVTAKEAAWLLGFSPHEMPILVAKGLLKPLDRPAHNDQKFFLAAELNELRRDQEWLAKASEAVVEHWRNKNGRKT